jgi:hypothetical protein
MSTGIASAWLRFKCTWDIRITAYGLESFDCSGIPPPPPRLVCFMFTKTLISILFWVTRMQYTATTSTCNIYFNIILLDMVSPKYFFVPSAINKFCTRSSKPDTCYMFRLSSLYQLTHSSPQSAFRPPNITWQNATPVPSHPHHAHWATYTQALPACRFRHCRSFRSV